MTLRDLNEKDVIQLRTGENLGRIDDFIFDENTAKLQPPYCMGEGVCSACWDTTRTL